MQKKSYLPLALLLFISVLGVIFPAVPKTIVTEGIDSGDTAWMLVSAALVLLMTPGLAYFYGGMVNNKNVISTMLQSFIAWVLSAFFGLLLALAWLLVMTLGASSVTRPLFSCSIMCLMASPGRWRQPFHWWCLRSSS